MAEVKDNLLQLDKVVSDLNKRLDENIDKIDRLSVVYNKFSKESANTPSQYVNVLNQTKTAIDNVTVSAKKLEQQSIRESNARNALNKQREQSIAQLAKEQAKLEASSNMYNKVQAKMNALSMEYKALATRKELGISLTDKEAKRYDFLQGKIQTYDKTLKAVDASMGKYQRNVGNYAGAFNPLSNSINQLSREMPAFANSVQTGFMAISNNLPIFFDSMGQVIAQNKQLRAEGKPTVSALSQLAGAFFSWGTALSVGVTLLTVYGKDIVEFASNLMKGSKAIDVMAESQKAMNDISVQARKNSTEEVVNMKLLLGVAKDTSLSYQERLIAVKELQQTYPAYFGNLTKEKILAGETSAAERDLTEAILSRAKANAAVTKITENQSKIIDLELNKIQLSKDLAEAKRIEADAIKRANAQSQFTRGEAGAYAAVSTASNRAEIQGKIIKNQKQINELEGINNQLTNFALENQKESIKLDYEEDKSRTKKIKAKKEEQIYNIGTAKWITEQISKLRELNDTMSDSSEEYQVGVGAIKFYEQWLERLTNTSNKAKKSLDGITLDLSDDGPMTDSISDRIRKEGDDLRAWYKDFRQGFTDDFWQNSGFSKVQFVIDNWEKLTESGTYTALAISEAFQQAFNTISNASQQNFDAEYSRLEQQKENSLLFAGESADARENIERVYEDRRKEIQRREAESQKRLAIFNIGINTAQAIVATLAKTPLPTGLPLAALMAAIGAAQIAMVSAQQIPQFWKGTDNAPEGWAWTQEKGAEVITDKSGNVKTFGSNKGAELTYLNSGDKVYKSHEDYINRELMKNGIQPMGKSFNFVNASNGLTAEDLNNGIESLKRAISQKENISINIDKNGFRTAVNGKNHLNNRLILKGRSV
jgi:DNA repair exonuclease SbcCD ATPase subunit